MISDGAFYFRQDRGSRVEVTGCTASPVIAFGALRDSIDNNVESLFVIVGWLRGTVSNLDSAS